MLRSRYSRFCRFLLRTLPHFARLDCMTRVRHAASGRHGPMPEANSCRSTARNHGLPDPLAHPGRAVPPPREPTTWSSQERTTQTHGMEPLSPTGHRKAAEPSNTLCANAQTAHVYNLLETLTTSRNRLHLQRALTNAARPARFRCQFRPTPLVTEQDAGFLELSSPSMRPVIRPQKSLCF
jgi:hypothetical protein